MRQLKVFGFEMIAFNIRINNIVARATEGYPIKYGISKFREALPWLNMMGDKVPSRENFSASSAGIFVPIMNISLPYPITRSISIFPNSTFVIPRFPTVKWVINPYSISTEFGGICSVATPLRTILSLSAKVGKLIKNLSTVFTRFVSPPSGPCFAHQCEYSMLRGWCQP